MGRANRNLGSNNPTPTIDGFNPGGDDFGVIRSIDGHDPYKVGIDGSNVHVPSSSEDPGWHDLTGIPVEDC